jgi:aldehyde dehydrogenase (NAD+)
MDTIASKNTPSTITTHYIDGAFVESHGRDVVDIISPTSGQAIGRVRAILEV